jgi:ditrans,polycis-polyprenyl diphosphate synthase
MDILRIPGASYMALKVKDFLIQVLKTGPVPKHISIVMDGNRRYARKNHKEIVEGHNAGFDTMSSTLETCYKAGINTVTVFAFSIENFKRPTYQVNQLMDIAKQRLIQICENGELAEQYGVRVRVIGNRALLPDDVRDVCEKVEDLTKNNNQVCLNICFPYTSRDDIAQAIRKTVAKVENNELDADSVDEQILESNMYLGESPPVDMLIRSSGVERFSDFMLWQSTNSDGITIEFVETLWPEFNFWTLYKILLKWSLQKV